MSYDIVVGCHTCGSALNSHTNVFSGIPQGIFTELSCPVHEWNGKIAMSVLPMLQGAVERLSDLDEYSTLAAKYNTSSLTEFAQDRVKFAQEWLTDMRDACAREPLAVIYVS